VNRFLSSRHSIKGVKWILQGLPLDMTVTRLHGTSSAPGIIRDESRGLETFSFLQEQDLDDVPFFDIGDLVLVPGDLEKSLMVIGSVSAGFFRKGFRIASLGGEHLASLPVIRAASTIFPELVVIHIDAHADLRDSYHGMKENHATVMRRVAEECLSSPSLLYQFGIRSGTRDEYRWGMENTSFSPFDLTGPLERAAGEIGTRPVYLSIDIDAIDPGEAPGTGTPEPCGLSSRELFKALPLMKDLDLIGFDIVEVSPPNDVNNITSVLAAKIARECLIMWGGACR